MKKINKSKRYNRMVTEYYLVDNDVYGITLDYKLGGYSFVTGTMIKRGYHLIIIPAVILSDGIVTEKAWDGAYKVIEPTKRYSKKRFDELVTAHVSNADTSNEVEELLNYVMSKSG